LDDSSGADLLEAPPSRFISGACGAVLFATVLAILLAIIGSAIAPSTNWLAWALVPLGPVIAVCWVALWHGSSAARHGAAFWTRVQMAAMLSAAVAYGVLAAAVASTDLIGPQVLSLAFLLAAASGPTYAVAAHRPAISGWLLLLVGPSIAALCFRAQGSDLFIALTLALATLLNLRVGLNTHRRIMAASRYRVQNDLLMLQQREQMRLVARASQEKTRFLAAAAHDLRQPLHALGLFGASLEQRLRSRPEGPLVHSMQSAIESMENSFSSILDISRLDAGIVEPNFQVFPIRDLFRRMYLQYAGEAERRDISLRFRASGRIVRSDPQLLERVVSNLIQNALRYTLKGGVLVAARRAPEGVHIEVWDTGIGIPANKLELIFEEFFQVDNPERDRTRGVGMGLSIVRRVCRLLAHEIEVKSTPNRGSLFRVNVPAGSADAEREIQLGGDTLPPRATRNITVMVIDDEEPIRRAMTEFLAPQQIRVLAAGSIAEAVALAQAADTPIDVIFSDLRLRAGEDGIRAVQEVRRVLGASTPAVLLTGDTTSERIREAHEGGLIVLFKPLQARQVLELINRMPA
jgi:signal transduction histidine kinase/CheY-like chemotaxis protein